MPASQTPQAAPRRGRPPTGARERILEAAVEVLKDGGYAGLSIAKVAAAAGESKPLIAYHYGSKDGLVAAAGGRLAEDITTVVLDRIRDAATIEEIVTGVTGAVEALVAEDERVPRVYFDLAAVSVVEPGIRATIAAINEQWRVVLDDLIARAEDAPPKRSVRPLTLVIVAGAQGLALEQIERGGGRDLAAARKLFVRSTVAAAQDLRR